MIKTIFGFIVRIAQNFFTAGFDSTHPRPCQNTVVLDFTQTLRFRIYIHEKTGSQRILNWLWVQNYA